MDPTLASALTSLAANWMSSFSGKVARDAKLLVAPPAENQALKRLIDAAVDSVLGERTLQALEDPDVVLFLASPEVARVVSRMFVSHLGHVAIDTVQKEEFAQLGSLWTGGRLRVRDAEDLFDLLSALTDALLARAIEEGVLAAHEARSSFRFHVLMGEHNRTQELFASGRSARLDVARILAFEAELRRHVAKDAALMTPPYFDSAKRVAIDSLFVPPRLSRLPAGDDDADPLSVAEFVSQSYRAVVLGNPGGGKSTLAQKICHDLATLDPGPSPAVTPILVTLREYGVRKRKSGCSLKDFFYEISHSHFQLDPPALAFEYLLSQGRLLVILDGLDELVDTTDRQRITADVEHFGETYSGLPIVVTSRRVGYNQAPLDPSVFELFELGEFTVEQATDYATKWFSVDPSLSAAERSAMTDGFMRECHDLADLRANVLMLGLLCNIYRGENWIPRNRPEVYEKCALMLFDRWDRRRGITAFQAFQAHLRPALEYLAHWIFCDVGRQGGVSESELVDAAATYLLDRRFEDEAEAALAAREFIEFCRGRAWVFTDTGTSAGGEPLYQFTHRTFLEYFTAVHLTRTHSTPQALGELLRPHILHNEWDMVSQLAVQIQDRQIDRAGDDLLGGVIDDALTRDGGAALAGLGFAARTLHGLVPRPATARRTATESARLLLREGERRFENGLPEAELEPLESQADATIEVFGTLLASSSENWGPVEAGALEAIAAAMADSSENAAWAAAELGANLDMAVPLGQRVAESPVEERWRAVSSAFVEAHLESLRALARSALGTACDLLWVDRLSIESLLESHALEAVFAERQFACFPRTVRIPVSEFLLGDALGRRTWPKSRGKATIRANLEQLGRTMTVTEPPWVWDALHGWRGRWVSGYQQEPVVEDPTGELFVGLFGLLAVLFELTYGGAPAAAGVYARNSADWLAMLPEEGSWGALWSVFEERKGGAKLDRRGLPVAGASLELVSSWARGDVDLVAPPGATKSREG